MLLPVKDEGVVLLEDALVTTELIGFLSTGAYHFVGHHNEVELLGQSGYFF